MKYATFLAIIVSLTALPSMADTVTIGTVQVYDAGSYTIDPAALRGFELALGDELCKRAELPCEWAVMAQEDLFPSLKSGEVDVVMAALPAGAELGDDIETTVAYLQPDPFIIVGLPGTETFTGVRAVASVPDPAVEAWHATTGYRIDFFPTLEEALQAVEIGRVDGVIGERVDLVPLVEASAGQFAIIAENDRIRPGVVMALRTEDIDLRFALEDRVFDMTQDGSLNALTEEWFGIDAADW